MKKEHEDYLIYYRPHQEGTLAVEPTRFQFQFSPGPDISEFKEICRQLSLYLGYDQWSVQQEFGTGSFDIQDIKIFEFN